MIVECPRCQTRFRLPEERIARGRPLLKCSRCQHVFNAPRSSAPSPPPPRPPAKPPEQESLSFSFADDDDWTDGTLSSEERSRDSFSLDGSAPEPPARKETRREPDLMDEIEAEFDDEGDDPIADDAEEEEDVPAGGSIRIRSVFVFLTAVVLGYLAVSFTFVQNPGWALRVTRQLPLIGGVRDRLLTRSVTLSGIQGRYERSREGKAVLLVTGQAHNQSSVSLNRIQIITKLFDSSDRQLDEQLAFCGHSVRPELVRDLTIRQIAILKGLKPPQRFNVQPGETCDFVTIFTEMSAPVATFTAEVSAAQRHA